MGSIIQIKIKNRTDYFFNDMINVKNFESNLLKIDKETYKSMGIYYIGYIAMKNIGDYDSIHSVNPWYLIIDEVDGNIWENNGNKYLMFASLLKTKKN